MVCIMQRQQLLEKVTFRVTKQHTQGPGGCLGQHARCLALTNPLTQEAIPIPVVCCLRDKLTNRTAFL